MLHASRLSSRHQYSSTDGKRSTIPTFSCVFRLPCRRNRPLSSVHTLRALFSFLGVLRAQTRTWWSTAFTESCQTRSSFVGTGTERNLRRRLTFLAFPADCRLGICLTLRAHVCLERWSPMRHLQPNTGLETWLASTTRSQTHVRRAAKHQLFLQALPTLDDTRRKKLSTASGSRRHRRRFSLSFHTHPPTSLKATRQQRAKPPMMGQLILRFEPQVVDHCSTLTQLVCPSSTRLGLIASWIVSPKAAFQRSRSPTLAEQDFDAVPRCPVPPSWWGTLHVSRLCELTIWEFKSAGGEGHCQKMGLG